MKKRFLLVFLMFFTLFGVAHATDILYGTDMNLMEHAYYKDVPSHDWNCTISILDENGLITNTKDINYISDTIDIFVIPIIYGTDYNNFGLYTINCTCYNSTYDVWDYSCDEATEFRVKSSLVGSVSTTILGRTDILTPLLLVCGVGILGFIFIVFRR